MQVHQSAVFQSFGKKVITPYMVVIFRSLAIAGIVTAASIKLLMLFFADFQPFLAPQAIDSLEVNPSFLFSKRYGDPAIAISRMFHM